MASRNMPPGWGAASKTVTAYPLRRSCYAAVSPAGPEPTTATRLPFGAAGSTGTPRAGSCVGEEALDPADRQRSAEGLAGALRLARRVAGVAEAADEWRRFEDQAVRGVVVPLAHEREVPVRLDSRRAGEGARRGAGAIDQRQVRNGLREGLVRDRAGGQTVVELRQHAADAAAFHAQVAAGAAVLVDEPRPAPHLHGEVADVPNQFVSSWTSISFSG